MTRRAQVARASASAVAVAVAMVIALTGRRALAFRTTEDTATSASWGITGPVPFSPLPALFSVHSPGIGEIDFPSLEAATRRGFDTWSDAGCGLDAAYAGATDFVVIYGDDWNIVEYVERDWPSRGFSSFTIGVTTNQLRDTGAGWVIPESDMELNADDFTWVLEGGRPELDPAIPDVESIVVHEAGHFFGLLHPCEVGGRADAPSCTPGDEPATMYPRYAGDPQRTLEADDIAGLCYLYPPGILGDGGVDSGGPPIVDAAIARDGAAPDGAAPSPDASADVDGARTLDAGAPRGDAGVAASRSSCDCGIPARPRAATPLAIVVLVALGLRRARRARQEGRVHLCAHRPPSVRSTRGNRAGA
jgi:hypothetical protein